MSFTEKKNIFFGEIEPDECGFFESIVTCNQRRFDKKQKIIGWKNPSDNGTVRLVFFLFRLDENQSNQMYVCDYYGYEKKEGDTYKMGGWLKPLPSLVKKNDVESYCYKLLKNRAGYDFSFRELKKVDIVLETIKSFSNI